MKRLSEIVFAAGIMMALAAAPSSAQNLVTNPGFDTGISGWTSVVPLSFDSTHDANGSASSGSLSASTALGAFTATAAARQCVPGLTAGMPYTVGGKSLFLQAPASTLGVAWIQVNWFLDNTCTNPNGADEAFFLFPTIGVWQTMTHSGTVPAGVGSARIDLGFQGEGTAGDFVVNFDDINFQQSAAVPTAGGRWLTVLLLMALGVGSLSVMRRSRPRAIQPRL